MLIMGDGSPAALVLFVVRILFMVLVVLSHHLIDQGTQTAAFNQRSIFGEMQLWNHTHAHDPSQNLAQPARSMGKCLDRVAGIIGSKDADKNLGVFQVARHFNLRNGDQAQPRILEFSAYYATQLALKLLGDPA